MRLPSSKNNLWLAINDILRTCTATSGARIGFYNKWLDYYSRGSTGVDHGRANKIKPVINRQSSFLYAPESTKFWADVSPDEDTDENYKRADPVSQVVSLSWTDSGLDTKVFEAVKYSRVQGARIMSILPRMRTDRSIDVVSYNIDPRYFGVFREDSNELENQQAVSLTSFYPFEEIERRIRFHPERTKILKELYTSSPYGESGSDSQVIEMGPGATTFQADYTQNASNPYNPGSPVTYYAFNDLYVFDDEIEDWRVFTLSGNTIVWDRPIGRIAIPGMLPFVKICAEEHPDYFWGVSLVEDLIMLQNWYTDRMEDIDNLIGQILDPPTFAKGLGQSFEEKLSAFRKAGGKITSPNAAAGVEQFVPNMPDQVFEFIGNIDSLFMDASNMRPSMFGRQETGVRTEGMAASMLRVAGAEMRVMGLKIEKQVQALAQMLFRYLRRYSTEKVIDEDGKLFSLVDFPDDARIRVDGHSSNPLFVEDNAQLAMGLMRYGAITQETLVRMLHPALEGKILHDLRKIQWIKVAEQQKMQLEQQAKRSGKKVASEA